MEGRRRRRAKLKSLPAANGQEDRPMVTVSSGLAHRQGVTQGRPITSKDRTHIVSTAKDASGGVAPSDAEFARLRNEIADIAIAQAAMEDAQRKMTAQIDADAALAARLQRQEARMSSAAPITTGVGALAPTSSPNVSSSKRDVATPSPSSAFTATENLLEVTAHQMMTQILSDHRPHQKFYDLGKTDFEEHVRHLKDALSLAKAPNRMKYSELRHWFGGNP